MLDLEFWDSWAFHHRCSLAGQYGISLLTVGPQLFLLSRNLLHTARLMSLRHIFDHFLSKTSKGSLKLASVLHGLPRLSSFVCLHSCHYSVNKAICCFSNGLGISCRFVLRSCFLLPNAGQRPGHLEPCSHSPAYRFQVYPAVTYPTWTSR